MSSINNNSNSIFPKSSVQFSRDILKLKAESSSNSHERQNIIQEIAKTKLSFLENIKEKLGFRSYIKVNGSFKKIEDLAGKLLISDTRDKHLAIKEYSKAIIEAEKRGHLKETLEDLNFISKNHASFLDYLKKESNIKDLDPHQARSIMLEITKTGRNIKASQKNTPSSFIKKHQILGVKIQAEYFPKEKEILIHFPEKTLGEGGGKVIKKELNFFKGEIHALGLLRETTVNPETNLLEISPEDIDTLTKEQDFLMKLKDKEGILPMGNVSARVHEKVKNGKIRMKFCNKGDGDNYINKRKIQLETGESESFFGVNDRETDKLVINILRGLENCHKEGIIHNDIKPGNILIDNENAFIADFGEATSREQPLQVLNGTRAYFSPEKMDVFINFKAKKESQVQREKSDIWAMGLTLYELYAGKEAPWKAMSPKKMNDYFNEKRVVNGKEERVIEEFYRQIRKDLPGARGEAIIKMLALDPQERIDAAIAREIFEKIE